jgi:hypothetical protein
VHPVISQLIAESHVADLRREVAGSHRPERVRRFRLRPDRGGERH